MNYLGFMEIVKVVFEPDSNLTAYYLQFNILIVM